MKIPVTVPTMGRAGGRAAASAALVAVLTATPACEADTTADAGSPARATTATTATTPSLTGTTPTSAQPTARTAEVRQQKVKLPPLERLPSRSVRVPGAPAALVSTPGALWVQSHRGFTAYRIDTVTGRVTARIDTNHLGCGDLGVAGGSVWWTGCSATPGLVRIDPDAGVVEQTYPWSGLGVAELDGELWVGHHDAPGHAEMRRGPLDAVEDATSVEVRGLTTAEGVVASQGSVWVSDAESAVVYKIDPTTEEVEALTPVAPIADAGYLVEHDGDPWYVDAAQGTLTRIDPVTGAAQVLSVRTEKPSQYWGIAASSAPGRTGRMWVRSGDSEVWLVDTDGDRVLRRVRVLNGGGGDVQQVGDTLWVSSFRTHQVQAIDLR